HGVEELRGVVQVRRRRGGRAAERERGAHPPPKTRPGSLQDQGAALRGLSAARRLRLVRGIIAGNSRSLMPTSILTCPHCGASLAASRFAATTVCRYCNATVRIDASFVSARAYREAWHEWNDAHGGQAGERFSIGDAHWTALR